MDPICKMYRDMNVDLPEHCYRTPNFTQPQPTKKTIVLDGYSVCGATIGAGIGYLSLKSPHGILPGSMVGAYLGSQFSQASTLVRGVTIAGMILGGFAATQISLSVIGFGIVAGGILGFICGEEFSKTLDRTTSAFSN